MTRSRRNPDERLGLARVTEDGVLFETGRPVSFRYVRGTRPAPNFGARYQQDIEPAGRYMVHSEDPGDLAPGWESGKAFFESPLVLWFNTTGRPSYDEHSWKARLFRDYGLTGAALAHALKQEGYDGIVTVSRYQRKGRPSVFDTREIVDLQSVRLNPDASFRASLRNLEATPHAVMRATREAVRRRDPEAIMDVILPVAISTEDQETIDEVANAYWHARGAFDMLRCERCGAEGTPGVWGGPRVVEPGLHGVRDEDVGQMLCASCIWPGWRRNYSGRRVVVRRNPYHGTRKGLLRSIRGKGLLTPFVSSDESQARCWADGYADSSGEGRVLEFDVRHPEWLVPDFNFVDPEVRARLLGVDPDAHFDVRDWLGNEELEDALLDAASEYGSSGAYDSDCGGMASIYLGTVPWEDIRVVRPSRNPGRARIGRRRNPDEGLRRLERSGDREAYSHAMRRAGTPFWVEHVRAGDGAGGLLDAWTIAGPGVRTAGVWEDRSQAEAHAARHNTAYAQGVSFPLWGLANPGPSYRVTFSQGGMVATATASMGGARVGRVQAVRRLRNWIVARAAVVPELRRTGVATELYTRLARAVCFKSGNPLVSEGFGRSPAAGAVWAKLPGAELEGRDYRIPCEE